MEPLKAPFKQPLKEVFYLDGKAYTLLLRQNGLAGYGVSQGSKILYYLIFIISTGKAGVEYLIGEDTDQIQTLDAFMSTWNRLNRNPNGNF